MGIISLANSAIVWGHYVAIKNSANYSRFNEFGAFYYCSTQQQKVADINSHQVD
jgi:hypothetical protein